MKYLIVAITLLLSINLCAQNEFQNTKVFVRIYDLQSKKIAKGKIVSISETAVQLANKGETIDIPLSSIGAIKTKRSAGHNVLVGAGSGATAIAILGAATADPDDWLFGYTAGEGAAAGALLGGTAGAAIGGLTILFKNSKSYDINGDKVKLEAMKASILN